jgi:hypothetical protein
MSLILIGAHPCLIHYDKGELITKHFWGNEMEKLIQREKIKEPIIHTIDILPGGTYEQDIFDNTFVKEHQESYHQIYLIDCGGIWYVLQSLNMSKELAICYNSLEIIELREKLNKLSEEELQNLIKSLIEKLYSMLLPNGICVFSKFVNSIFQEEFIQQLNKLGIIYEIENQKYVGIVIIVKKENYKFL